MGRHRFAEVPQHLIDGHAAPARHEIRRQREHASFELEAYGFVVNQLRHGVLAGEYWIRAAAASNVTGRTPRQPLQTYSTHKY
jgi:hypothetical protein